MPIKTEVKLRLGLRDSSANAAGLKHQARHLRRHRFDVRGRADTYEMPAQRQKANLSTLKSALKLFRDDNDNQAEYRVDMLCNVLYRLGFDT